jgi:hypothetical protein
VSVGIEGVTPQTLRHTFASVAGELGFSELTIWALPGHGSQSVTQDYIHIDEALKLAATRTCEEAAASLTGETKECTRDSLKGARREECRPLTSLQSASALPLNVRKKRRIF